MSDETERLRHKIRSGELFSDEETTDVLNLTLDELKSMTEKATKIVRDSINGNGNGNGHSK